MEFGLKNKTAIISGGAGYIGKVYVSTLLKNGANVIIVDKIFDKKSVLNELKKEFKVEQNLLKKISLEDSHVTSRIPSALQARQDTPARTTGNATCVVP